jgi:hypothetical protein
MNQSEWRYAGVIVRVVGAACRFLIREGAANGAVELEAPLLHFYAIGEKV